MAPNFRVYSVLQVWLFALPGLHPLHPSGPTKTLRRTQKVDPRWGSKIYTMGVLESRLGSSGARGYLRSL